MENLKEINGLKLQHINNGAHFQFFKTVTGKVEDNSYLKAHKLASPAINNLKAAFGIEDENLQLSRKSFLTDEISATDRQRDFYFNSYKQTVQTFLRAAEGAMAEAAKTLDQHIKDYNISTTMQLERETGLLTNFINDIFGKYKDQITLLGLTTIVSEMQTANQKVEKLLLDRNNDNTGTTAGALRNARLATDEAYRYFVKVVNAIAILEANPEVNDFIDFMNTLITRYKQQVIKKSSSTETPDNAPTESNTESDEEETTDL